MARASHTLGRATVAALIAAATAVTGCLHPDPGAPLFASPGRQPCLIPTPGTVPIELQKVTLPEYVIEPPDILRIEAYVVTTAADRKRAKEEARKRGEEPDPDKEKDTDNGGPELRSLPLQPVWGEYTVRPDGRVNLGTYGTVPVAGYTLNQTAETIRDTLAKQVYGGGIDKNLLRVLVDVTQYASKRYYVIFDGGGYGEQVYWFTPTGSETVLDAIANVTGLNTVASKRDIWVARRCPTPGLPEQILPVDWVGITQHGVTTSNYQILPGDRVYVKALPLVTLDTNLARLFNPIERVFGITLLGASTVNTISGRGLNNTGN